METLENGLHDGKCGLSMWEVWGCFQGSRLHNGVVAGSLMEIGNISVWMAMMVS